MTDSRRKFLAKARGSHSTPGRRAATAGGSLKRAPTAFWGLWGNEDMLAIVQCVVVGFADHRHSACHWAAAVASIDARFSRNFSAQGKQAYSILRSNRLHSQELRRESQSPSRKSRRHFRRATRTYGEAPMPPSPPLAISAVSVRDRLRAYSVLASRPPRLRTPTSADQSKNIRQRCFRRVGLSYYYPARETHWLNVNEPPRFPHLGHARRRG